MKPPEELARKWRQQWELADYREERLLTPEAWPLSLSIGRPTPAEFMHQTAALRDHVQRWRAVTIGRVVWEKMRFRAGSEAVEVPIAWQLDKPSDWVAAAGDEFIEREYQRLGRIISASDKMLHRVLVRQRHLLAARNEEEIIKAAELAMSLAAGAAGGRPLRAFSTGGVDSKFFERNRSLLLQLLDVRYDGRVSDVGLEAFLGALDEDEHWLLVAPLSIGLLPFRQQRVRATELGSISLPGSHLLIVENERCLYQIPELGDTVAVLGAGLNLTWMQGNWLREKRVGYWGDIDTWGLSMLASARGFCPELEALLMTREVFDAYASTSAVVERAVASDRPPVSLTPQESELYDYLRRREKGRLEQEFLPTEVVRDWLMRWRNGAGRVN